MGKISLGVCLMFLVVSSTVYEVQGTFLLRHYMRRCPLRRRAFRPFACKGMLSFCDLLQRRCPLTPQYSNFFSKMKSFLSVIQSSSGSSNFDADLKTQAQGLQSAMSQMGGGSSGSADSSKVINVLMSMGKTLGDTEKSGSVIMTRSQRRELIFSMITWARTIAQYVMTSTSKNGGASINMSSLGIDDDGDSPKSGGSPGGPTGSSPGGPTGGSLGGPTGGSPGGPTGGSPGGPIGGSPGGSIGGSYGGPTGGSHGGSTGSSSGSSTSGSTGSMGFTAGSTGGSSGGSPNGTPKGSSGGSASGSTGSTGFTASSTGFSAGSTGSTGGSTGSSCNTCNGGNTNGGSSFKGSMNFQQQAGKQMSQDSSVNSSH